MIEANLNLQSSPELENSSENITPIDTTPAISQPYSDDYSEMIAKHTSEWAEVQEAVFSEFPALSGSEIEEMTNAIEALIKSDQEKATKITDKAGKMELLVGVMDNLGLIKKYANQFSQDASNAVSKSGSVLPDSKNNAKKVKLSNQPVSSSKIDFSNLSYNQFKKLSNDEIDKALASEISTF